MVLRLEERLSAFCVFVCSAGATRLLGGQLFTQGILPFPPF